MPEPVKVRCPQCDKTLNLRDRSLLGSKGRCPNCRHQFILGESTPQSASAPPAVEVSAPSSPLPPSAVESADDSASKTLGSLDEQLASVQTSAGAARLHELRRRTARRRNRALATIVVTGGLLGGLAYHFRDSISAPLVATQQNKVVATPVAAPTAQQLLAKEQMNSLPSPTQGKPIQLLLTPAGARLIVHLHPAFFWQRDSLGEEVRLCWGRSFSDWANEQLHSLSRFEPAQIDEALICLILGSTGTPPEVSAVFRLADSVKRSDIILAMPGERVDDYSESVWLADNRAYLLADDRTIAVCQKERIGEVLEARKFPNPTADGMESLLQRTDRQRHLTVLFEPAEIQRHRQALVPESLHPLFDNFVNWFGDEVETVAWSWHLGKEFFSEMYLRNRTATKSAELEEDTKRRVDDLPLTVYQTVLKMNPQQRGPRQVIGRFPAMVKVLSLATQAESGTRFARLATRLPARAGPNLSLGTLLTWEESTRTDFSSQPRQPSVNSRPDVPDSIIDRLRREISVDFRRTPLQEAIAFVADELHVAIEIDGDALKLSGYTKNMPQTFALEQATGLAVLHEITRKYDAMCIVIDEQAKQATVTTTPVAKGRGLTPFPLQPAAR